MGSDLPLRTTVYLRRGAHDELIAALEYLPKWRRAGRFRQLLQYGLQGEALERRNDLSPIYGRPSLPCPKRDTMRVFLIIEQRGVSAIFAASEPALTKSGRLAALANKGLCREARVHEPMPRQRDSRALPEAKCPGLTRTLMSAMVEALQKDEPL